MNLIDVRLVVTQILGFLLMLWVLRRYAWGPVLRVLAARREKIAEEFRAASRAQAEAAEAKTAYEVKLRAADAEARQRIQAGVAEGQQVATEIRAQAQREAQARLQRAEDEVAREREQARELLKEQVIGLSLRTAEKILHQKLDDAAQRRLAGEFIDEVGALR
ncbi:MAG TPA: F0F1 ATP synthase subunit B [Candidatus Eisenbacteria bacterium]|nr:F0F1 ATP synthase subunit B [Candidatus Eisenbacteria bacterium]